MVLHSVILIKPMSLKESFFSSMSEFASLLHILLSTNFWEALFVVTSVMQNELS